MEVDIYVYLFLGVFTDEYIRNISVSIQTTKKYAKDFQSTMQKCLDDVFIIESTVLRLLHDFSIQFVYSEKTKSYFTQ